MSIPDTLFQPPRRYLRYLHLREAVRLSRPDSVLIVGAGRGVAEVAIAREFPDVHFHLTDWDYPHPRIERGVRLAGKMPNVSFSRLDILKPDLAEKFDLVGSVEVLEHIQEDDRAAENMRGLSSKDVFCLVPFATAANNADPERRQRVWENNEHYVVGYDPERLEQLFPNPLIVRGAYWIDVSTRLKSEVAGLTPQQVKAKADELKEIAKGDLRDAVPRALSDAVGIWTLSAGKA